MVNLKPVKKKNDMRRLLKNNKYRPTLPFTGGLDVAIFYTESLDLKEERREVFKGAQESQTQTLY